MKNWKKWMQRWVVHSAHKWPRLRTLYDGAYGAAIRCLQRCARGLSIRSLHIRQGLLEESWTPGTSDIDTLWVADSDPQTVTLLLRRLERTKKIFPFLGEPQIVRASELDFYLRQGDAKRRTASLWRPLIGERFHPAANESGPAWKWPLDCWTQALEAYERLFAIFFQSRQSSDLIFKIAARKHLLDLLRWLEWGQGRDHGRSREETARHYRQNMPDWMDAEWIPLPNAVPRFALSRIHWMLGQGLQLLDAEARRLLEQMAGEGSDPARWPSDYQDDAWEGQAWEKHFQGLRSRASGALENIVADNVGKTHLILSQLVPAEDWKKLADGLAEFSGDGGAALGSVVVCSRPVFQLRLWSLIDGTPFAAFALRRELPVERAVFWRSSRHSFLKRQVFGVARGTGDYSLPPRLVVDVLAREAAANWLLNRRTMLFAAPEASPLFSLRRVLLPWLCLKLYFEKGLAGDPADLDGAVRAAREAFPAETAWLENWEKELNRAWRRGWIHEWSSLHAPEMETAANALKSALTEKTA